jgi:hypothetical protein
MDVETLEAIGSLRAETVALGSGFRAETGVAAHRDGVAAC